MSNSYASNSTLHLKQSQEFWSIEVQLFQECTLQGNCGDSSEFILDLKQKIKCNCHGVRGCQERGDDELLQTHFTWNTEQRSLETSTHIQGNDVNTRQRHWEH